MAAVFHYFQGKCNIDLDTLTQANAICQWYLGGIQEDLFAPPPIMYGPPQAVTDAQELEVWLVLHFLKYGVY